MPRRVRVLIAANQGTFKLAESRNATNTLRRDVADDAPVIFGTAVDESLGDQLRVTVIATGLSSAARKAEQRPPVAPPLAVVPPPMAQPVLRTGTDNLPVLTQPATVGQGAPAVAATHDDPGMNTPSVWRSASSRDGVPCEKGG